MAVGAGISVVGGIVQRNKASDAEERASIKAGEARKQLAKDKEAYKNLDTSNPWIKCEVRLELRVWLV